MKSSICRRTPVLQVFWFRMSCNSCLKTAAAVLDHHLKKQQQPSHLGMSLFLFFLFFFCFLFFLFSVFLSWYSWPCELSWSSDDVGRRQPDQLSSWWWYKDAVMGMFWSLCNVLVLHDALCCMQVRYKPDRGFCTRFFSFRRASWAGTGRHFSAQHHGQTRSCTELFLHVLCAGWIRKNRVRRQRSSKATQHSAGEDQQPVSFPNTYLPPVYMPTSPPSSTKLSVICLSVWGLHTYACLYHVIWLANECRKTYIVTLQQIVVGGTIVVPANIQAIVDTGTSFTYFSTPVYTQFAEVVRIKRYFLLKFIACVCFQSHMFQKFPVFFSHSFLRFLSSVCNWSSISYLSFCRLCVFHLMFFFGISWEHVNKLSSTYGFFTAETMPFPCRIRRVYPRCTSKQMIWV